jgi:hypothetical protein
MKYILLALMFFTVVGCGTVDCNKCPVVVKTKILTPTISCYRPESYDELQKSLLSTSGVESEGKLFEIITTNVKMMEMHIKLWEGYHKCVEDTLKLYSNDIKQLENNSKKDDK